MDIYILAKHTARCRPAKYRHSRKRFDLQKMLIPNSKSNASAINKIEKLTLPPPDDTSILGVIISRQHTIGCGDLYS